MCDLNFIVKSDGLLKVASSHVHGKSGNISVLLYGLANSSNCDDLESLKVIPFYRPFQVRYFVFVARRAVPLHLQSFLWHLRNTILSIICSYMSLRYGCSSVTP